MTTDAWPGHLFLERRSIGNSSMGIINRETQFYENFVTHSEFRPYITTIGLYNDARAQLNYLKGLGIHHKDWILYGESLGTGVAVNMAYELDKDIKLNTLNVSIGGLILEAPFSSMPEIAQEHYPYVPARLMVKDHFDSISKINKIDTPLFIVHGQEDKVISVKHGVKLFLAAIYPKESKWIPLAGHNNLYEFGMAELVIDFIKKYKP